MFDFFSSLLVGVTIHDADGKPWMVVWPLEKDFYLVVEPDVATPAPVMLVKGTLRPPAPKEATMAAEALAAPLDRAVYTAKARLAGVLGE